MDYTLEIESIRFEVEYRKVRMLRLTVYPPDGRVKVAVPAGTDRESVLKFIFSKIAWIKKHRERFLNNSKPTGPLKNHSAVYVWGAVCGLEVIEREGNQKIAFDALGTNIAPGTPGAAGAPGTSITPGAAPGGRMRMYIRPGSTLAAREALLDKWYRSILKETASGVIKKWEDRIGVEVKKLYVRKMKTHWGSCNYERQTLRLNSELAKRTPDCLEYVIVHEMLHIIEKGHNRAFYRLMNRYLPEWKTIRKKMNGGA